MMTCCGTKFKMLKKSNWSGMFFLQSHAVFMSSFWFMKDLLSRSKGKFMITFGLRDLFKNSCKIRCRLVEMAKWKLIGLILVCYFKSICWKFNSGTNLLHRFIFFNINSLKIFNKYFIWTKFLLFLSIINPNFLRA